ncbi:MAG: alpha/beta hydrolase fold domain-containing protein [Alphaproteobacteria bacterium]|nr:alpha/beta hydrolase fold domain-containing protein [Alphaproteobacteria bacterium]
MDGAIYRDYNQESLDVEYNNRGRFPDTADCKDLQIVGSNEAKAEYECRLDVKFGDGETDLLDIYIAEGDGPRPIHVFFHGGYWKSNTKNDFGFVAKPFVPYGITAIVVEYPLIPSVRMGTLIDRCRASMEWTFNNAESFGGDKNNITISGHSAGGHITAMMMQTDWPSYGTGLPKDLVKGGCSISGVSDLDPVRLSFQNEELQFDKEEAAEFSTLFMNPTHPGPLLAVAGGIEGPEFIRQTTELADAWAAKGMEVKGWIMEGKHHFTTINQYLDGESELSRAVRGLTGV